MLEVIAKNLKDIIDINKSKANRIEYCINLEHGGMTPKIQDINLAVHNSALPIMIILREHYDNFDINSQQLQVLLDKLTLIKNTGAHGIVYGAVSFGKINIKALELITSKLDGLEITFHKAFDHVDDFSSEAKRCKRLRVNRILTSGGHKPILENIDNLMMISKIEIEILIGGGLNYSNIKILLKLGFRNFHIGRAARYNNSWEEDIDIDMINSISEMINKY